MEYQIMAKGKLVSRRKATAQPDVTAIVSAVLAAMGGSSVPAVSSNVAPARKARPFTESLGKVSFVPDGRDGRYKGMAQINGRTFYLRAYDGKQ
jgi:hypothetical protein